MPLLFSKKSLDLIARVFLSAVFVNAIPFKITNFSYVLEVMTEKGIPGFLSPFLLVTAIAFLFIGSILLVFGSKQKLGALLLLAFLIPATIIFHIVPFQIKPVLMNLGLMGGLILSATRRKSFE